MAAPMEGLRAREQAMEVERAEAAVDQRMVAPVVVRAVGWGEVFAVLEAVLVAVMVVGWVAVGKAGTEVR